MVFYLHPLRPLKMKIFSKTKRSTLPIAEKSASRDQYDIEVASLPPIQTALTGNTINGVEVVTDNVQNRNKIMASKPGNRLKSIGQLEPLSENAVVDVVDMPVRKLCMTRSDISDVTKQSYDVEVSSRLSLKSASTNDSRVGFEVVRDAKGNHKERIVPSKRLGEEEGNWNLVLRDGEVVPKAALVEREPNNMLFADDEEEKKPVKITTRVRSGSSKSTQRTQRINNTHKKDKSNTNESIVKSKEVQPCMPNEDEPCFSKESDEAEHVSTNSTTVERKSSIFKRLKIRFRCPIQLRSPVVMKSDKEDISKRDKKKMARAAKKAEKANSKLIELKKKLALQEAKMREAYLAANEAKVEEVVLDVLKMEDIAKMEGREKAFEEGTTDTPVTIESSNSNLDLVGTTDSTEDSYVNTDQTLMMKGNMANMGRKVDPSWTLEDDAMTVDSTNAVRLERKESKVRSTGQAPNKFKSDGGALFKSVTKLGRGGEMAFPDVLSLEKESKQKKKVYVDKILIERFHYDIPDESRDDSEAGEWSSFCTDTTSMRDDTSSNFSNSSLLR